MQASKIKENTLEHKVEVLNVLTRYLPSKDLQRFFLEYEKILACAGYPIKNYPFWHSLRIISERLDDIDRKSIKTIRFRSGILLLVRNEMIDKLIPSLAHPVLSIDAPIYKKNWKAFLILQNSSPTTPIEQVDNFDAMIAATKVLAEHTKSGDLDKINLNLLLGEPKSAFLSAASEQSIAKLYDIFSSVYEDEV